MTVSVLLEGVLKEGHIDSFIETCREKLVETRASERCIRIDMTLSTKDRHNFVMTEVWETAAHYEAYRKQRQDDGTSAYIISCCEKGPSIRMYDILDL